MEERVLLWIHDGSGPWLDVAFRFSHELGTGTFCTALVTVAVFVSLALGRRDEAALWLVLGVSTFVLQLGIKLAVGRHRPELWEGPIALASFSFPSGHALAAATFFPLLGRAAGLRWPRVGMAALAVGVSFAFFVGFGRLYLGVHWPTDVLAGWAIGAAQTQAAVRFVSRRDLKGR